jgi:hypothetical protein
MVNTNLTLDRMTSWMSGLLTTPTYLIQERVVIRKDPISFLDGVGYHLLCTKGPIDRTARTLIPSGQALSKR